MPRILVIDDDEELCELLSDYLGEEGYEVVFAHDGETGARRAIDDQPSMIILDVMLPKLKGFDVLKRVRQQSSVPIVMLTARGEEVDRIVGLELGADDYLGKPFNPRELLARIRAISRRIQSVATKEATRLMLGDIELDPSDRSVKQAGLSISLTSAEFALLEMLLREAGAVVSRDALSESVLGRPFSAYDRSIDVHVSNLRKKLGPRHDGEDRIKTVRGVGYVYGKG